MDKPKGSDFLRKRKNDVSIFFGVWMGYEGSYIYVYRWRLFWHFVTASTEVIVLGNGKGKGKVHPCTGIEALYRP